MKKPTAFSVTGEPCGCGFPQSSATDPLVPIRYDTTTSEYWLEYQLANGSAASLHLHHCPICGGALSESRRHEGFSEISETEIDRLEALTEGISTLEHVLTQLGVPDMDTTIPANLADLAKSAQDGAVRPTRAISYHRLSSTAIVQFVVYSDGHVERVTFGKHLNLN